MTNLHEQFHENIRTLYSAGEMSEILISMYTHIELAIKLNADKLKVSPTHVFHLDKDEKILHVSELIESKPISSIGYLDLIMSRDSIVMDLLELIAFDDEEVTYKIT